MDKKQKQLLEYLFVEVETLKQVLYDMGIDADIYLNARKKSVARLKKKGVIK